MARARGVPIPGLRAARIARLWTQQRLSDESGVSLTTINRIERTGAPADLSTIEKLARVLGVEASVLMRGERG